MDRTVRVANPEGLHARPAAEFARAASGFRSGILVRRNGADADAASILEILALDVREGDVVTLSADGPDADQALTMLASILESQAPRRLRGIPASPGAGVAPAWVHRVAPLDLSEAGGEDPDVELADLEAALARVVRDLERNAEDVGGDAAQMLRAQASMAEDPTLWREAEDLVKTGLSAAKAMVEAGEQQARRLERSEDATIRARGEDIRQVADRVARTLLGRDWEQLEQPGRPSIIVARDLTPGDTARLDPRLVRGLATETGSASSHTSILARSLGVPAVVAVPGLVDAAVTGELIGVDGDEGVVHLSPDPEARRQLEERKAQRRRQRRELRARFGEGEAATRDGHRVELAANVRNVDEVQVALQEGAEAVGLFRTELFYLNRSHAPTETEQAEVLGKMSALLRGRRLVVRTFDIGADKPAAFLPTSREPNPELGLRGVRLAMRHPDVLDTQIRAVIRAARGGGRLAVMAPMVSTVDEVEWFVDRVVRAGGHDLGVEVGVMVEIPAAVLTADELAERLDFLSIGTNDLTQYLFAADRRHPELATYQDPFAPAVLRAVQLTCAAAERHGAWVGVCGEAAADPRWAVLAAGLGVTELSMQAASILDVRAALAERTLEECVQLAHEALTGKKRGAS